MKVDDEANGVFGVLARATGGLAPPRRDDSFFVFFSFLLLLAHSSLRLSLPFFPRRRSLLRLVTSVRASGTYPKSRTVSRSDKIFQQGKTYIYRRKRKSELLEESTSLQGYPENGIECIVVYAFIIKGIKREKIERKKGTRPDRAHRNDAAMIRPPDNAR